MLSVEQQNIIENSMWVVNAVLKKQGLSFSDNVEDLRQSATLCMCKAIQRFDPSLNVKWETFAYKTVYLHIKRENAKELKHLLWETKNETAYYSQPCPSFENHNQEIEQILKLCTPQEKKYLKLKMEGFKRKEISEKMGVSKGVIRKFHENIIKKAREKCL